jgi:hypothetical protein
MNKNRKQFNKNGSTTTSIQATVWATAAALSEDNFIGPRYSLTSEEIQRKELKGSFAYEN